VEASGSIPLRPTKSKSTDELSAFFVSGAVKKEFGCHINGKSITNFCIYLNAEKGKINL
jgi:hypothetical protein